MRILFFQPRQEKLCIVIRRVVHNQYLIVRVILFQDGRKGIFQVMELVMCAYDHGNAFQPRFLFRMPVTAEAPENYPVVNQLQQKDKSKKA